jgi:hypothetical protein
MLVVLYYVYNYYGVIMGSIYNQLNEGVVIKSTHTLARNNGQIFIKKLLKALTKDNCQYNIYISNNTREL